MEKNIIFLSLEELKKELDNYFDKVKVYFREIEIDITNEVSVNFAYDGNYRLVAVKLNHSDSERYSSIPIKCRSIKELKLLLSMIGEIK